MPHNGVKAEVTTELLCTFHHMPKPQLRGKRMVCSGLNMLFLWLIYEAFLKWLFNGRGIEDEWEIIPKMVVI